MNKLTRKFKKKVTVRPKRKSNAPTHGQPSALSELRGQVPLFPARVKKKLAYYEPGFQLDGVAGAIAQYVFTANGLYDPNITGTGHQPMGFDTMMLYYEQYTVIKSRLTLRIVGNGSQAASVSVCLAPDTTALSLPSVVENGLLAMRVVEARGNTSYGTGTRIERIDLACDVAKYFGRSSAAMINDTELCGTVSANPVEQVYYVINTWGFSGFSDNTSVQFDAVIEYEAEFWEPRKVSAMLECKRPKEEIKAPAVAGWFK